MRNLRVKVFSGPASVEVQRLSPGKPLMEEQVNQWLQENTEVEVQDIKYSYNNNGWVSALVIYQPHSPRPATSKYDFLVENG